MRFLAQVGISTESFLGGPLPALSVVLVGVVVELKSLQEELGVTWEGYMVRLRRLIGNERFATLAGNDLGDHVAKNVRREVIAC